VFYDVSDYSVLYMCNSLQHMYIKETGL